MTCDRCGNENATHLHYSTSGYSCCDSCGKLGNVYVGDVFFDGKPCEHLLDDRGQPMQFVSKNHKARWMKERGIAEAGGRYRGGPFLSQGNRLGLTREQHRQQVAQAFKKAKEQSRYRR